MNDPIGNILEWMVKDNIAQKDFCYRGLGFKVDICEDILASLVLIKFFFWILN